MKKALFDDLAKSLGDAVDYLDGKPSPATRVHTVRIDRNDVAAIRLKAKLTQADFAKLLGASKGTVMKWESGERAPSGAAETLLRVLDFDPTVIDRALGRKPAPAMRTPRSRLVAAE